MTPAARIAAVIDILSEAPDGVSAGAVLRRGLQQRRYAGSGDRQAISALFWTVHRAAARIGWHLEQLVGESTPRSYVLVALRLADGMDRPTLAAMFEGADRHGPAPLEAAETKLVEDLEGRSLDDLEIIITPSREDDATINEFAEIGVSRLVLHLGSQRPHKVDGRMANVAEIIKNHC